MVTPRGRNRIKSGGGFVAEREVSDDVALDRRFQQRPLEPGWVAQMTACEAAIFEARPNQHLAAKRFSQSETFAHLTSRIDRSPDRPRRQVLQDLIDQSEALLDLANAHPDASVDVTRLEHGNFEIEPIVGRIAGGLAGVESAAAGPPDIPAGPALRRQLVAQDPSASGAVLQRRGIVVELDELR